MRALSMDLRERIVAAYDGGGQTQKEVAGRFGVSKFTVSKLLRQRRETGDLAPRYARCSGKRKILAEHERKLRELLEGRADMTLEELRDELGLDCTIQAVHYALGRMGLTYKKRRSGPASKTART
jgi:transposase